MNKMLKHSLSIGFIATAPLAAADTALHCTTIQDNATRLACYDNIYSAQLPPQSPLPQTQTETAKTPVDLEKSVRKSIEKREAAIVFDNPTHPNISDDVLSETADSYTPLSLMYDLDKKRHARPVERTRAQPYVPHARLVQQQPQLLPGIPQPRRNHTGKIQRAKTSRN